MKKLLVLPFCCISLIGCGTTKKLYKIDVDKQLFNISMKTYSNGDAQAVKASVKDNSDTNYLVYLVDQNGIVTNCGVTSKNKAVVFSDIKSDSKLYASKSVVSSLATTGVQPTMINNLYADYYNDNYTDKVETKIDEFKNNNAYTPDKPLLIYNAYGTDELSMYCYFNSEEKTVINYQVITTNHNIFSRNVETDFNSGLAYSTKHEFCAHGMIAGELNYVLFNSYNTNGICSSYYTSYRPKTLAEMDVKYTNISLSKETLSPTPLSEGLFSLGLGQERYEPNRLTHMSMIDNNAEIRWFVPMNDSFFHNIFIQNYKGENCLVYVIDYNQLVYVNYLGQTKKIITLLCPEGFKESGSYKYFTMHHDFCFDNCGNILALAGKCSADVIEDKETETPRDHGAYVIKYNIKTDEVTVPVYIDKSLLTNYRDLAMERIPEGWKTDWFHPNTIQFANEDDGNYLMLSSRESSAVLRVKLGEDWPDENTSSIANPPQIKWVLTNNKDISEKESSLTYLSRKESSTVVSPNLGQHTTYIINNDIFPDRKLDNNEYYLAMFSNNTTMGRGTNNFDFEGIPQPELDLINVASKARIYLVNETSYTYECIFDKNVKYAPFMGSFVYYNNHFISQSTSNASIVEYDIKGNQLIKMSFENATQPEQSVASYRAIKIDV